MAMKINVGESEYTRQDFFFVDPFQVIVREELRGRHKPPLDEAVIEMAESMMEYGQRQPVECRKMTVEGVKDRLVLNLGFTRTAASRLIRTGFTGTSGERRHDPDFKLKVTIGSANDETAFIHNIVENAHRNQTSAIDDAFNQERLRDRHGKSDAEIARLYHYKGDAKVGRLRRLLALPTEIQDLIHEGKLGVEGGLELLDLPEDKRAEAIQQALGANGKIISSRVREAVRDHMEQSHILNDENRDLNEGANPEGGTTTKKSKARGMREVREFLTEQRDKADDQVLKSYYDTFLLFIKGTRGKNTLRDALMNVYNA